MGGDLLSKKRWHVGLLVNQRKVWEAERVRAIAQRVRRDPLLLIEKPKQEAREKARAVEAKMERRKKRRHDREDRETRHHRGRRRRSRSRDRRRSSSREDKRHRRRSR